MNDNESECIVDFAGNYKQTGFWCDYYPSESIVRFGGSLQDIPVMPCKKLPLEEDCEEWINQHSDYDFRSISKLDVMIILEEGLSKEETIAKLKVINEKLKTNGGLYGKDNFKKRNE